MTHIPQSNLEVAQRRLTAFMDEHNATLLDCSKIMGIGTANPLKEMLKKKCKYSMYTDQVISIFGVRGVDRSIEKLHEMRGGPNKQETVVKAENRTTAPDSSEAKTSPEETVQQLARRMFMIYRDGQDEKLATSTVADRMNGCKPLSISRAFKQTGLCVAFSPTGLIGMSDAYAEDILTALARCPWSIDIPVELDAYKVEPGDENYVPLEKESPEERIQDAAIRMLGDFESVRKLAKKDASTELGYSATGTSTIRSKHKVNMLGDRSARQLIERIEHYNKNNPLNTAEAGEEAMSKSDARSDITDGHAEEQLSPEDSAAELDAYMPTEADLRDILSTHFEHQTGFSIAEIRSISDDVELLLLAKRRGVKPRIVIDTREAA